jgi:hypothetical protein
VAVTGQAPNGAHRIDFKGKPTDPAPTGPAAHTVLKLDELTVKASCISSSRVYVTFSSSVKAYLNWESITFNNPGTNPDEAGAILGRGLNYPVVDVSGGNTHIDGQWIYRNAKRTITIALHADATSFGNYCTVQGTALPAPR